MDVLLMVMSAGYVVLAVLAVGIGTSATNRKLVATWLIASAKAIEERRSAHVGILTEQRLYQKELQERFGATREALIHRR